LTLKKNYTQRRQDREAPGSVFLVRPFQYFSVSAASYETLRKFLHNRKRGFAA